MSPLRIPSTVAVALSSVMFVPSFWSASTSAYAHSPNSFSDSSSYGPKKFGRLQSVARSGQESIAQPRVCLCLASSPNLVSSSAVFRMAGTGESLTDLPYPFKPSSIRATASIYGRGRRTTTRRIGRGGLGYFPRDSRHFVPGYYRAVSPGQRPSAHRSASHYLSPYGLMHQAKLPSPRG